MNSALADTAARDLTRALRRLALVAPHGSFSESSPGLAVLRSGSAVPTLNGVVSWVPAPDPSTVGMLAGEAAAAGPPWSIQLRRAPSPLVLGVASGHGLARDRTLDLLGLPDLDAHGAEPAARAGFRVRPVQARHGRSRRAWAGALSRGFGMPPAAFGDLCSRAVLDDEHFTAYLGEEGELPVATGFSALEDGALGIFGVSTHPAHRGRGAGRAVLARILFDGYARGASRAYLQAPAESARRYSDFGFERLESWSYLVAAR
ncbi:GNAT family N-acetyltransferase [Herbiconiux solani]|uniref:GNAT family N-acetyltransferase n=1 Tax=Herbiconiux solani TaxID=661329 RepID=UPI000826F02D|nr:GNAT family N-acetyltransferase [Herbiconiux solani]